MSITKQETWLAIFRRKGAATERTNLYVELADWIRNTISSQATQEAEEVPVIASFTDECNWVLITTDRIIARAKGILQETDNKKIISVAPIGFGIERKAEMNKLSLRTRDGNEYVIAIEAGPPFIGIWNVIRNIVQRNE